MAQTTTRPSSLKSAAALAQATSPARRRSESSRSTRRTTRLIRKSSWRRGEHRDSQRHQPLSRQGLTIRSRQRLGREQSLHATGSVTTGWHRRRCIGCAHRHPSAVGSRRRRPRPQRPHLLVLHLRPVPPQLSRHLAPRQHHHLLQSPTHLVRSPNPAASASACRCPATRWSSISSSSPA